MEENNHRIVLVSGGIKLGGAAAFLLNLGGELTRRGIPVLVVSLEHENPYASDFELLGIPLHLEDERKKIFEDRIASALEIIRDFNPTTVVSCLGPSSYEILRYVPNSVTRLGMMQADSSDMYPVFAVYAPFFHAAIGVSRQIEMNFRAHPILGKLPTYYLPYGVPIPKKDAARAGTLSGPIRILYLGRLVRPQKRVHLFPDILHLLRTARIPFRWTIAGDGPERPALEKEMTSVPPNSVIEFKGALSYRDLPRLFDSNDIFLLASDSEGLPLSLLEAMAHGLVPVVSNLPSGVSEVVDQECGILVEPDNIEGYAAGIISLAQSPSRFSVMAKKAKAKIDARYSAASMTDRWITLLNKLDKGKNTEWPSRFAVKGPLSDPDQQKYAPYVRGIRRLLKKFSGSNEA